MTKLNLERCRTQNEMSRLLPRIYFGEHSKYMIALHFEITRVLLDILRSNGATITNISSR